MTATPPPLFSFIDVASATDADAAAAIRRGDSCCLLTPILPATTLPCCCFYAYAADIAAMLTPCCRHDTPCHDLLSRVLPLPHAMLAAAIRVARHSRYDAMLPC